MRKIKTFLLTSIITLGLLSVFGKPVEAGFGISPAYIENQVAKKGTRIVQDMVLSRTDYEEAMRAVIEPELGDLNGWVTFEPSQTISMPAGQQRTEFRVIIDVPADAQIDSYKGLFRVYSEPETQVKGISIVEGVRVDINLATTDINLVEYSVRALKMDDSYEKEDLKLEITLNNEGNVPSSPTEIEVDVRTLNDEKIKTLTTSEISKAAPYDISIITAVFRNHGIFKGEYFGDVRVYEGTDVLYKDTILFKVAAERIYKEECTGAPEFISNRNKEVFLGVTVLSVIVFGALVINDHKSRLKKAERKKRVIIYIAIFIVIEAFAVPFLYFDAYGLFVRECKMIQVNPEESMASVESTTEIAQEQVQGASTIKTKTSSGGSLIVEPGTQEGKYKIFKEADLNSEVIYLADQGELFNVLEEETEWYKVELKDGATGWLAKINVASQVVDK